VRRARDALPTARALQSHLRQAPTAHRRRRRKRRRRARAWALPSREIGHSGRAPNGGDSARCGGGVRRGATPRRPPRATVPRRLDGERLGGPAGRRRPGHAGDPSPRAGRRRPPQGPASGTQPPSAEARSAAAGKRRGSGPNDQAGGAAPAERLGGLGSTLVVLETTRPADEVGLGPRSAGRSRAASGASRAPGSGPAGRGRPRRRRPRREALSVRRVLPGPRPPAAAPGRSAGAGPRSR
jgi:hypothetical protein